MVLARPGAVRAAPRFLVLFGAFWASLAAAQADPDEPKVDPKFESQAEKARREGEKVFKWIRLHSNSPQRPAQPMAAGAAAAPGPATKAPVQPAGSERPKVPPARVAAPVAAPSVSPPPPARAAVPAEATFPQASTPVPKSAAAPVAAAAASLPAASAPAGLAVPPGGRVEPPGAASAPKVADTDAGSPLSHHASPEGVSSAAGLATPEPGGEGEDSALVLVTTVEPDFPAVLMRRLRKGWVQVRVVVSPDGSVAEAEVAGSSHPRLNEPALAAVRRWAFKPPGQAREATAELEFDLDGR